MSLRFRTADHQFQMNSHFNQHLNTYHQMNSKEETTTEPLPDNWMEQELNRFYNGAIQNCIEMIKFYYDKNEIPQDLINSLNKLKK